MKKIWVDAYRPKTLDEYIFSNEDTKNFFNALIKEQEIPNLLISGIQGTGKSAIAKIIIDSFKLNKNDVRIINASSDNGIANVRERIEKFCQTLGLSKFKIVLLEEADGLSHAAQKALRSVTENYTDNVRFILTCNYPNKIIAPLHSRLQHIHIDTLDMDSILERVAEILEAENIEVDDVGVLMNHINTYYPDMRKIINSLQQSSKTGKLVDIISKSIGAGSIEEWEMCWKNSPHKTELLKIIKTMELDNIDQIFRVMYDNIISLPKEIQNNAIVIIAEHLYKSSFIADQEINLVACVINIFDV